MEEKVKETEKTKIEDAEAAQNSFKDYMESLDGTQDNVNAVEEGQVVEGTVIQVTRDFVFLDVGCKCEGSVPIEEFLSDVPKVGDKVQVFLEKTFGKDGSPKISKEKADSKAFWQSVQTAYKERTPVPGRILGIVKGGYSVVLGADINAFLPTSQADMVRVEDPKSLLKMSSNFIIDKLKDDNKVNIVVSRRRWMEMNLEQKREEFFRTAKVGDVLTGTVKSFTSFGAFVDLGGFDALLHVNDMSWGHVIRPKDFVKKGEQIKVKLIRLDPEAKRINVSLKHFTEDPWVHFEDKFHINQIVEGTVTKFTDFGAFVELEEGIEGLVHISEFSWTKKIADPADVLKIGQKVNCMILGYDIQAGRVSLGIKQAQENPWDKIEEKYPAGSKIKGKIARMTGSAAFVNLEEGIDAYLNVDDISWTKRYKHPGAKFTAGDEIEAVVLESNAQEHHIRIGIKQLEENPWVDFSKKYQVGSTLEGEISSITDEFGVFVKTDCGIEGLINKSNLSEDRDESYEDAVKKYKVGDKINVYITDINPSREKVGFSVREFKRKQERDEISQYMASVEQEENGAYTIGDMLNSQNGKKSGRSKRKA